MQTTRRTHRLATGLAAWFMTMAAPAGAGPLDGSECIVGAKAGGGFDLTCKLAQAALAESGLIGDPMRLAYLPGGIGAIAFNNVASQRPSRPNAIVAFSGGTLLNLAQGRFGPRGEADVRWLAAIGMDHGAVMVPRRSPHRSLKNLLAALKADPNKIIFGGGGGVGSQDWMKAALTARAAGVPHKALRYVAFEGGGEAIAAMQGGHVDAVMGDASESTALLSVDPGLRILAVLSDSRLPGPLSGVPTAREEGFDIQWPIPRGFYMGPGVGDEDVAAWRGAFQKMLDSPAYARLRAERGLSPLALTGKALDEHVRRQVQAYRRLADEFGLMKHPTR